MTKTYCDRCNGETCAKVSCVEVSFDRDAKELDIIGDLCDKCRAEFAKVLETFFPGSKS